MKSSADTINELFAKAAANASKSSPKPALTKAGIALTADARYKLQQLARWIELEQESNQDPRVRLGHHGGVVTYAHRNITFVSPMGALVQMFQPFKLEDAKPLGYCVHTAGSRNIQLRAANILGITVDEFLQLQRYIYVDGWHNHYIVKALRTLK